MLTCTCSDERWRAHTKTASPLSRTDTLEPSCERRSIKIGKCREEKSENTEESKQWCATTLRTLSGIVNGPRCDVEMRNEDEDEDEDDVDIDDVANSVVAS